MFFYIFIIGLTVLSSKTLSQTRFPRNNFYFKLSQLDFELDNSFVLSSFESNSILKCFTFCSKTTECFYIAFKQKKCFICKVNFINFVKGTINSNNSLIYQKNVNPANGLINYWTFNGNVNDVIGNAHLYDGVSATLTTDRFGQSNSALSLTNGYYKVPPGVYFSGQQFSLMVWLKVRSTKVNSRLIDFGNGPSNENIVLILSKESTGKPYLYLQSGLDYSVLYAENALILNKWQHLTCIFSYPYFSIYIDGIEITEQNIETNIESFSLAYILRTSNFIGRSNWYFMSSDEDADAEIDDLKIFRKALTKREIHFEMNNNF